MTPTDDLDPATLRWVADDHEADALTLVAGAAAVEADDEDDPAPERWRSFARRSARTCKRLRALATRIERRRGTK